jgi:hypothetical protein
LIRAYYARRETGKKSRKKRQNMALYAVMSVGCYLALAKFVYEWQYLTWIRFHYPGALAVTDKMLRGE